MVNMDTLKYRKFYLCHNWGRNRFIMKIKDVGDEYMREYPHHFTIECQKNHPLVLSGNAFWITHNQLCTGYVLDEKPEVFRPIFSHKRQRMLEEVHYGEEDDDGNKVQNITNPYIFWNKIKTRYFLTIAEIKKLPVVCIDDIIMYLY